MEYYARLESQISKLTPETVVEALRKHLHPDRILVAIAGDFEPKKPTAKESDKPADGAK